jgi:predicted dehydrogenase
MSTQDDIQVRRSAGLLQALRVASVGNRKVNTDSKSEGDAKTEYTRDVPEIVQLIAEFPSGIVMHVTSSTINELGAQERIRGHKASLDMGGNNVELRPERPFSEEIEPETSQAFPSESVAAHHKNFHESIRANKQPNAGIDLAVKVQTVIALSEASERLGVMCYFDERTRKVKDGQGREIKMPYYGWNELS